MLNAKKHCALFIEVLTNGFWTITKRKLITYSQNKHNLYIDKFQVVEILLRKIIYIRWCNKLKYKYLPTVKNNCKENIISDKDR